MDDGCNEWRPTVTGLEDPGGLSHTTAGAGGLTQLMMAPIPISAMEEPVYRCLND